ncbi:MAG: AAA family ATPase, partial [Betaproteobacteria bacterium]|nr:AAA family ATPase [Betaproteobacteria bacterium]
GQRFANEPSSDVLDCLANLPPREMRRAWMTAFGNARLNNRDEVSVQDLPNARGARSRIGFLG